MVDVSVILTAHSEGILLGPTFRSARDAIVAAPDLKAEVIVVLDRPTPVTRAMTGGSAPENARVLETSFGDPGLARNAGIEVARGRFSCFLDGDDLWSENWLDLACKAGERRPDAIFHSHANVVFGEEQNFWWHIDSEGPLFDPDYLFWANYWDAMSFSATEIYRDHPFRANDLSAGFGHEDWHWNRKTLAAGIAHKPVPETLHFKRRRPASQMAKVAQNDAMIWPD